MDEPLHDIDRLFRDSLEPGAQTPSDGVWAKINAGLDGADRRIPFVRTIWTKRLVPMVFLMGLCFIGHRSTICRPDNNIAGNTKVQGLGKDNKVTATVFQKETKGGDTSDNNSNLSIGKTKPQQRESNAYDKVAGHDPTSSKDGNKVTSRPLADLPFSSNITDKVVLVDRTRRSHIISNNKKPRYSAHKKSIINKETNGPTSDNDIKGSFADVRMKHDKENPTDLIIQNNRSGDGFLLPVPRAEIGASILALKGIPTVQNLEKFEGKAISLSLNHLSTKKPKTVKGFDLPISRWYISTFAAQEWQGYELQDNDDHPATQQNGSDNRNSIKHGEDEDPSLAVGLNLGYQINKKISVETGIRFGGYQIRTDSAKLYAQNNNGGVEYKLTTSSGYAYLNGLGGSLPMAGDSIVAQKVKQSISYLGIPILFRYRIGNGRISFNPALGFVLNFITGSTVSANLGTGMGNDMQRVQLQGLKNLSVVVMLNPSVYYRWNKHFSLGLEPYLNYNISPINNTNVVKSYPYGIGLGIGIKYHF